MEKRAEPELLWRELKRKVESQLKEGGDDRYADRAAYLRIAALLLTVLLTYGCIMVIPPGFLWLGLWAVLGLGVFLLIANCGHDAAHGSVFRSRRMNRALLIWTFGLLGIDGVLWGLRHLTAHHPHTNVARVDPDSVPNPYLRLSPHHPRRPWFKFQHLYAIFLYPFAFIETFLWQDFQHILLRPLPYTQRIRSPLLALARTTALKTVYLGVFIGFPLLAGVPLQWLVAGLFVKHGFASLVFVLTVGLNHYVCETIFFDESYHSESHLIHQLRTSADWDPSSRLWCSLMGGANAHTAHHLFPALHHRHCVWISASLASFAEEHHLPYNSFSFLGGLRSHFRFLYQLGHEA